MVARTVDKRERNATAADKAAVNKEWQTLRSIQHPPGWDEANPRELRDVMREARAANHDDVNVGRMFDICAEKGSALPDGDPYRKFNGARGVPG